MLSTLCSIAPRTDTKFVVQIVSGLVCGNILLVTKMHSMLYSIVFSSLSDLLQIYFTEEYYSVIVLPRAVDGKSRCKYCEEMTSQHTPKKTSKVALKIEENNKALFCTSMEYPKYVCHLIARNNCMSWGLCIPVYNYTTIVTIQLFTWYSGQPILDVYISMRPEGVRHPKGQATYKPDTYNASVQK